MSDQTHAFFWNIHQHVGPGCPNPLDDVQLVQLMFLARAKKTGLSAEGRAIYGAVNPSRPYTGAKDDPLTRAIVHMQSSARRGVTPD